MGIGHVEKQSGSIKKHGGKRPRAGRRKGIPNKITAEMRQKALALGKSPLEMLQYVANEIREAAEKMAPDAFLVVGSQVADRLTLLERAAEVAEKAAPYMHARLQAIEHKGEGGGPIQQRVIVEFV